MLKNHKGNRDAIPVQQEPHQEEREAESFAAAEPKLRIQSSTVRLRLGTKRERKAESHSKKSARAGRKICLYRFGNSAARVHSCPHNKLTANQIRQPMPA